MMAFMPPMPESRVDGASSDLAGRILRKQTDLGEYLTTAATRQRWLINVTIITGTCAATLTAAPALGGKPFADWLTSTFGLSSPAWQILCAAAAICSCTSTVATQLLKSHHTEEHIALAQGVRAKLEILEVGLATDQLDHAQAAIEYMKCIEKTAFIQKATSRHAGRR